MYKNIDHKECLPNQLKKTENVSLTIVSTPLIENFVRKQTLNDSCHSIVFKRQSMFSFHCVYSLEKIVRPLTDRNFESKDIF